MAPDSRDRAERPVEEKIPPSYEISMQAVRNDMFPLSDTSFSTETPGKSRQKTVVVLSSRNAPVSEYSKRKRRSVRTVIRQCLPENTVLIIVPFRWGAILFMNNVKHKVRKTPVRNEIASGQERGSGPGGEFYGSPTGPDLEKEEERMSFTCWLRRCYRHRSESSGTCRAPCCSAGRCSHPTGPKHRLP